MALVMLLLGALFVLSIGPGTGFAHFFSDKIGVFKRKKQELAARIERIEYRIKARSEIIADLKNELDSYTAFSDSLGELDSLKLFSLNCRENHVPENLLPRPAIQKPATLSRILPERTKTTPNVGRLNSRKGLTDSGFTVSSEREPATINAVFNRHIPVLQDLYRQALKRDPDLKGSITLRFKLTREGHIKDLETVESTLNLPELELAIEEKVRTWRDFGEVYESNEDKKYKKTLRFGE